MNPDDLDLAEEAEEIVQHYIDEHVLMQSEIPPWRRREFLEEMTAVLAQRIREIEENFGLEP